MQVELVLLQKTRKCVGRGCNFVTAAKKDREVSTLTTVNVPKINFVQVQVLCVKYIPEGTVCISLPSCHVCMSCTCVV